MGLVWDGPLTSIAYDLGSAGTAGPVRTLAGFASSKKGRGNFHDLTPVAQQRVLHAAGMKDSSEGNFELSPLAILDYEVEEYVPQVGHIVNVLKE